MTKAKRMMQEDLKLIDLVIELVDARIPESSRNPDIDGMAGKKPRLVLLNKADLADPVCNKQWVARFREKGVHVLEINSKTGAGIREINGMVQEACREKIERDRKRGIVNRPVRAMVVGIPNVGKSTFINTFAGKACTKTGNKPGVTKGKQWIHLSKTLELLDTPGILWPKFEDQEVGKRLAYIGSIKDEILNLEELSLELLDFLRNNYPGILNQRFGISEEGTPLSMLEGIADARKCLIRGSEWDYAKASGILMDEFRSGKLGRITLEYPEVLVKNDEDNQ